jgi:hypothetical protein
LEGLEMVQISSSSSEVASTGFLVLRVRETTGDGQTTEKLLKAGDRLSAGGIDLEVVETGRRDVAGEPLDRPLGEPLDGPQTLDQQLAEIDSRLKSLDEAENIASQRQALEKQQAAWETHKAGMQQALEDRVAGLDALRVDLESQRMSMERERRQWETEQADDRQSAAARNAELESIRAELAAQRERLEEQCRRFEERLVNLHSREGELAGQVASEPQSAATTVTPEPTEQPAEQASAPPAAVPAPADTDPETEATPIAESENMQSEASTPAPARYAPVDLAAILRKTGFEVDLEEVDPQPAAKAEIKPPPKLETSKAESAAPPAIDISTPVPRQRKVVAGEEEVSIDDYMSRLLARSRGDSATPPNSSTSKSNAVRAPAPAPAAPAETPQPAPAKVDAETESETSATDEAGKTTLRAAAPERHIDIRAMRQLANLSAKNALQKHDSRRLSGSLRSKLVVTAVSGFIGVSLLIIHLMPKAHPVTLYGALASFAVSALWGWNYLKLAAELAGERTAYLTRHLKAGEAAVAADELAAAKTRQAETKPSEINPAEIEPAAVPQEDS